MSTAMISQPMNNLSEEKIKEAREDAIRLLESLQYKVIDTVFDDSIIQKDTAQIPVAYLAESIKAMSKCDLVYFCKGWEQARGCRIEHLIAENYGIGIIEEC